MPEHRIYTVDSDGHFIDGKNFECANDQEAIQMAQKIVDGRGIELWERSRFITRLASKSE
jgi:hypothetical protein